jgi:hypothetical protein
VRCPLAWRHRGATPRKQADQSKRGGSNPISALGALQSVSHPDLYAARGLWLLAPHPPSGGQLSARATVAARAVSPARAATPPALGTTAATCPRLCAAAADAAAGSGGGTQRRRWWRRQMQSWKGKERQGQPLHMESVRIQGMQVRPPPPLACLPRHSERCLGCERRCKLWPYMHCSLCTSQMS